MSLEENYENHIPAGVRADVRRAEEIARSLGVANVPPADGAPAVSETPPATIVSPAAAPAAPATPAEPPASPAENWEQRYRTLQGKYDTDVPQLRARVEGLERLLASVQAAPAQPASAPSVDTTVVSVPSKDVEDFGQELIDASQRWAEAKFGPQLSQLEARIAELSSTQHRVQRLELTQSQQSVMTALDADPRLGGKWRIINDDPEFIAWLNQVDPFTGQVRAALLGDAFTRGEAIRTGAFFKAFIDEHTAVSPAATHTPSAAPVGAGNPTLEQMAAPGRSNGSTPPPGAPAEKRVWTRNDISAFYRDRMRGIYAGREAEALRVEGDILAAAREGRVR